MRRSPTCDRLSRRGARSPGLEAILDRVVESGWSPEEVFRNPGLGRLQLALTANAA
ncbi:MAG: hypothetical protein OEW65_00325 [Thermoleophilia bacterium]|nr:hypothetical protein [Thermoleophilia bacterium]